MLAAEREERRQLLEVSDGDFCSLEGSAGVSVMKSRGCLWPLNRGSYQKFHSITEGRFYKMMGGKRETELARFPGRLSLANVRR